MLIEVFDLQNTPSIDFYLLGGDADNNNVVSGMDFAILKSAYGTKPGDPRWKPGADFNGNGQVDGMDFSILKANYGKYGVEPQIAITSPQNNAFTAVSPVTVSGTTDSNASQVTVNGVTATVIPVQTGIQNFTASDIPLIQGPNRISAVVVNLIGNKNACLINVTYDTDPPAINIYTPDKDSTTRSNIIYGRVSDDTASVIARTPSGPEGDEAIPGELLPGHSFIARPTLTEGPNTITVQATDKAGNISQKQINITYNTQTPKVTIASPIDNQEINISPIKVGGTSAADISFIMVNSATASVIPAEAGIQNFTAEGISLNPITQQPYNPITVITATGFDANNNKFQDAIAVNSPNLSHYELTKVSGDATEDDPNRPSAGSNQTLKVTLEKNGRLAAGEEIKFGVITPLPDGERTGVRGSVTPQSVFTDSNGEAQATLTTDTNSDVTNEVECFPISNPLVKATFSVDTKPAVPSVLTKITDDSVTPVPGATIPLIVKLTDSNNNPIPNETINFQVIQGTGATSSPTAVTTYYGEAKVTLTCPNLGLVLTQVNASSQTVPTVAATFNITTSAPLAVTAEDIIAKVNYNDSKIQDIKADITVTSNAEFLPSAMQLKIWQKQDKQKVQELSPNPQVKIRPPLEASTENITMQREIISSDPSANVYTIKTRQTGRTEEYPYQIDYVDYAKGITFKTEYYSKEADNMISRYTIEDSDFVQISGIWLFTKETKTLYKSLTEAAHTTTSVYSNIQVNTGIPDGEFQ